MAKKKAPEKDDDGDVESTVEMMKSGIRDYEMLREKRIKENMERMQKLGLLELSRKLLKNKKSSPIPKKRLISSSSSQTSPSISRRSSSRLKSMAPVSYSEKREKKESKPAKIKDIFIPEGSKLEFYTEDDDKLLGDCMTPWNLYSDGYDEDGNRVYDPVEGKSCHQCRQKTLGHRTNCSKCTGVQFCGDCLYTRYGENVIETNENSNWICPPCRGICNCSRCRRDKGWAPTGSIYRKVVALGFKSVAHFLIQTRGSQPNLKEASVCVEGLWSSTYEEDEDNNSTYEEDEDNSVEDEKNESEFLDGKNSNEDMDE